MSNLIVWAIILLGAAAILLFVELIIPSGTVALLAGLCLIGGIVMLFQINTTVGLIGATLAALGVPIVLLLMLKAWPNTPIGRMLTLRNPQEPEVDSEGVPISPESPIDSDNATVPVGARGVAATDLRPVGICVINGARTECLAETGVIRAGAQVRVVSSDPMQVKVRVEESV